MFQILRIQILLLLPVICFAQYEWTLEKEQQGIKLYTSKIPGSDYKATKVECTLTGNYTKLINILVDVPQFSNWIYHSKKNRLVQKKLPTDFVYHTETTLPWPMSNRETVIRIRINTDSLPAFLSVTGSAEQGHVAKTPGLVRVNHYQARWRVTMPAPQTLQISYQVELDPGGSIPGWMANMFVSKGPFETFVNLAEKLKE